MTFVRFIICCAFLLSSTLAYATEYNAGFVEGLWYSKEPVFAGETVRLYVAVRNNTGSDLTGRIVFYDNDARLASQAVSALDGRIIEAWTDWKPSRGEHELRAELERVTIDTIGGTDEVIEVPYSTVERTLFVDLDTDGDGIGNEDDVDDDNDGVSDEDEEEQGTDPLVYNEPAEETENETDGSEATSTATSNTTIYEQTENSGGTPRGLERYITYTSLNRGLTSFSEQVANTKEKLDTYRESRNENADVHIATSTASNTQEVRLITDSTPDEVATTFMGGAWSFVKRNVAAAYTAVLWLISFALGYPIALQILLLLFMLLLIYRVARRIGRRTWGD